MNKVGLIISGIALANTLNFAGDVAVSLHQTHYGAFNTLGVIDANGDKTSSYGTTGGRIDNQPYSRFGGYVALGATIEERTDVGVVLGMMTWNSLPLTNGSPFTRMQSLGSDLGQAFLSHKFGEVQNPFLTLKFGAFHYSYSSSNNLGGYLFTGGTYPGTLTSNFWSLNDGNFYRAQGMLGHFSFFENSLNVDVTAFFEHDLEPNYNLSPGIVASYKIGDMVEIGGGAVFSHLISWGDGATTPKQRDNAYYNNARLPKSEWNKLGLEANDTLVVPDSTSPKLLLTVDPSTRPDFAEKGITPKYITAADNGIPNSQLEYYTFKGQKVMGRITVTPFSFGESLKKVSLYSELTLLGVKNYPYFYEKRSERMPITFGVNAPLPRGFEFTAEAEHYKNKFKNDVRTVYENVLPQWVEEPSEFFVDSLLLGKPVFDAQGNPIVTTTPKASHANGEWFWSFTAKKSVYDRVTFTGKIAHDFLRLYNFFGNPSDEPAFQHSDGWYLAFKTEVNL